MDRQQRPVVVGFSDTPDGREALRWAARYATQHEKPLRVVVARGDLYELSRWADEWSSGLGTDWLAAAEKELAVAGFGGADLQVRDGLPAQALVRESETADCMVVGRSHAHVMAERVLGTVSYHVTHHAHCPVVVAFGADEPDRADVVVGVDGSNPSMRALEFALEHAAHSGQRLRAVHCSDRWLWLPSEYAVVPPPDVSAALEAYDQDVKAAVRAAAAKYGVEIEVAEPPERPAHALVEASRRAELVVVGSRGRGAFRSLVLGSVSAEVVRYAHGPVAVVR